MPPATHGHRTPAGRRRGAARRTRLPCPIALFRLPAACLARHHPHPLFPRAPEFKHPVVTPAHAGVRPPVVTPANRVHTLSSLRRKPESRYPTGWMPAFAGMTLECVCRLQPAGRSPMEPSAPRRHSGATPESSDTLSSLRRKPESGTRRRRSPAHTLSSLRRKPESRTPDRLDAGFHDGVPSRITSLRRPGVQDTLSSLRRTPESSTPSRHSGESRSPEYPTGWMPASAGMTKSASLPLPYRRASRASCWRAATATAGTVPGVVASC